MMALMVLRRNKQTNLNSTIKGETYCHTINRGSEMHEKFEKIYKEKNIKIHVD